MPRRTMSMKQTLIRPAEEIPLSTYNEQVEDLDNVQEAPRIRQAEQNAEDFQNYTIDRLGVSDAAVTEMDVEYAAERPPSLWQKSTQMPRWALTLSINAFLLLVIATLCVVFAFTQSKVSIGRSCFSNKDCQSDLGLRCTAGKCACGTAEYWNNQECVPQHTFGRSCTAQEQCRSMSKLLCMDVNVPGYNDRLCWCSSDRYWTGSECAYLKSFNETCSGSQECDSQQHLTCINGRCHCNSTRFWNSASCETKRTYGQQCLSTHWCNNATQGLQCSTTLPTAGTCDCLSKQYWWTANSTCLPQSSINSACTFDYQCLTNQSLSCVSDTNPSSCQCASNFWYNSSQCTPKFPAGTPCSSSAQCDDTRLLTCNSTALTCSCNETVRIWDGTNCIPRRTIGGACSSNIGCIASQNLICATSGVWTGTCACPTDYYWENSTAMCTLKKLWNQTCASLYECYDGGYLSCQPSAALNRTVCDCGNYTQYWTGFQNNTYGAYCTPKINYGVPSFTCVSSYQCRDYNYITCISGVCNCNNFQYWDGTMCAPRLNYSYPCNSTAMCRNWAGGPNLQCLVAPGGSVQQCLCTPTQYFDYCVDSCLTTKAWQQPCNSSTCYATADGMCDSSRSLSCISNICNCTNIEWWNSSSCVPKGSYLASCVTGQNYQCEQYNLLSCVGSQCVCGSTMYWDTPSSQCRSKKSFGGTCASSVECISSAGVGLSCISGTCRCSSGYTWNSAAQQCDPVG